MINLVLDETGIQLKRISDILARYITNSQIKDYLFRNQIEDKGHDTRPTQNGYVVGSSKTSRIYSSLAFEINKTGKIDKLGAFIETVCNPILYTDSTDRDKYAELMRELNGVLAMMGGEINPSGRLIAAKAASTLEEVDRRFNSLASEIAKRKLHPQVMKYCKREYLAMDYFHAMLEGVKGLLERIRDLTSLTLDGYELLNETFSLKSPRLVFNSLKDANEKNEYLGLKKLIEGLVSMIRNVTAHKTRISYEESLEATLEIFSTISFVHRYLDKCEVTGIFSNAREV